MIGTTGFNDAQKAEIADHAEHIAIVMAPNMSVGVNVVLQLLEIAARALADGFDVEIVETHHRHKVDAPSGTALKMGEVVAAAPGRDLEGLRGLCARRPAPTGERDPRAIGFSSMRGGDIVGDHTVLFAGTGERIEITHRSSQPRDLRRRQPARRALPGRPRAPGLFGMDDVLGAAETAGRGGMTGFGHFWSQGDVITRSVAALLLLMSVSALGRDPLEGLAAAPRARRPAARGAGVLGRAVARRRARAARRVRPRSGAGAAARRRRRRAAGAARSKRTAMPIRS